MDNTPKNGNTFLLDLSPGDLFISEAGLLARLGYPDSESVSGPVRRVLDEISEPLKTASTPRAAARFVELRPAGEPACGFGVENGFVFSTSLVSRALFPAKAWAVFATTIGEPGLSGASGPGGSLLRDFCADAVLSVLAEGLAETVHKKLAGMMEAHGLVCGYRYSPGYCDWPVADNRELLSLAGAAKIGISLTKGGMMSPRKSVSAVIAFGLPGSSVTEPACKRCEKRCAHYRR